MIFFISDGRLGNQIFQYSFLKTLAKTNEKIIALRMNHFLSIFNVNNKNFKAPIFSRYALFFMIKILVPFFIFLSKVKLISIIEQTYLYGMPAEGYLKKRGLFPFTFVKTGFFQSEKMFKKESIDFSLKDNDLLKAKYILQEIGQYDFVFVHVRRGDYLNETFNGQRGINLPKKYFSKAMHEFSDKLENIYYIFLTDDFDYVDCCFNEIKNKYISKESMAVDLALMSSCKYGITSNSSFSWWGAYLMPERIKVIFPKYWYGWKTKKESNPGIHPSWATILQIEDID
jgi:hypothetical protein